MGHLHGGGGGVLKLALVFLGVFWFFLGFFGNGSGQHSKLETGFLVFSGFLVFWHNIRF